MVKVVGGPSVPGNLYPAGRLDGGDPAPGQQIGWRQLPVRAAGFNGSSPRRSVVCSHRGAGRRRGGRSAPLAGGLIAAELGADQGGVWAVQVFEDAQRLLPGVPGSGPVAGRLAGVAEMVEGFGLAVALA
jgi:hypothetical protein